MSQFSLGIDAPLAALDAIELPPQLRRAVPRRQLHFRAGRYCAARALTALDAAVPWPLVGRDERGVPLWPPLVVGSITHTDGFASAAVARAAEVSALGIDTEPIVSRERAGHIVQAVAAASEIAHARGAGWDQDVALTLVFSAKESIFKCLYPAVRRTFGFHDVRIVGLDGAAGTFRARIVTTLSEGFPADTMLEGRFAVDGSHVHTGIALLRVPARPPSFVIRALES